MGKKTKTKNKNLYTVQYYTCTAEAYRFPYQKLRSYTIQNINNNLTTTTTKTKTFKNYRDKSKRKSNSEPKYAKNIQTPSILRLGHKHSRMDTKKNFGTKLELEMKFKMPLKQINHERARLKRDKEKRQEKE